MPPVYIRQRQSVYLEEVHIVDVSHMIVCSSDNKLRNVILAVLR